MWGHMGDTPEAMKHDVAQRRPHPKIKSVHVGACYWTRVVGVGSQRGPGVWNTESTRVEYLTNPPI